MKNKIITFLLIILVIVGLYIVLNLDKELNEYKDKLAQTLKEYNISDGEVTLSKDVNESHEKAYSATIKVTDKSVEEIDIFNYIEKITSWQFTYDAPGYYYVTDITFYANEKKYTQGFCIYDCLKVDDSYIINFETGEVTEIEKVDLNKFIEDTFEYFEYKIGKIDFDEALKYISGLEYDYIEKMPTPAEEETKLPEITIYAKTSKTVDLVFFKKNGEEILTTVRYDDINYELSVNNNYHTSYTLRYNLHDKSIPSNTAVNDIEDLLKVLNLNER